MAAAPSSFAARKRPSRQPSRTFCDCTFGSIGSRWRRGVWYAAQFRCRRWVGGAGMRSHGAALCTDFFASCYRLERQASDTGLANSPVAIISSRRLVEMAQGVTCLLATRQGMLAALASGIQHCGRAAATKRCRSPGCRNNEAFRFKEKPMEALVRRTHQTGAPQCYRAGWSAPYSQGRDGGARSEHQDH